MDPDYESKQKRCGIKKGQQVQVIVKESSPEIPQKGGNLLWRKTSKEFTSMHAVIKAIYEFIQASLVFLEENQETYPDTYERAKKIYADSKNQNELLDKHALTYEPETSIQAIADRFGFSEQASFARYFKKNTGVTPTEYREGK